MVAAFHLQQAAEKRLKAALVSRGIIPRRSHDLIELANALGWTRDDSITIALSDLSDAAVASRYPGWEMSRAEVQELRIAFDLVAGWIECQVP